MDTNHKKPRLLVVDLTISYVAFRRDLTNDAVVMIAVVAGESYEDQQRV